MKQLIEILEGASLSDWRVNQTKRTSRELFFVHEKLETVRATDTAETSVTVYADHDGKRGDSSFSVSPAMDEKALKEKIRVAKERAALVFNEPYRLPGKEEFSGAIPTDLDREEAKRTVARIADAVWAAKGPEGTSLNALEIFLYRDETRVKNSRGLDKREIKHHAMIEAIPTFTDETGSVELYESFSFTSFDPELVTKRIESRLNEAAARAKAKKLAPQTLSAALRPQEIAELIWNLADDLGYGAVYQHANLFSAGDEIQKERTGDPLNVFLCGKVEGSRASSDFDEDGTALTDTLVIENGKAASYHGSSRFGQYLGVEKPSGVLPCLKVLPGTLKQEELKKERYLECVSLSGLQVDLYSDYIGGEIRLAFLHEGETVTPVTGMTMSASLSGVLAAMRLSENTVREGGYEGPDLLLMKNISVL